MLIVKSPTATVMPTAVRVVAPRCSRTPSRKPRTPAVTVYICIHHVFMLFLFSVPRGVRRPHLLFLQFSKAVFCLLGSGEFSVGILNHSDMCIEHSGMVRWGIEPCCKQPGMIGKGTCRLIPLLYLCKYPINTSVVYPAEHNRATFPVFFGSLMKFCGSKKRGCFGR